MVYSVEFECPQGYSPQGRALRLFEQLICQVNQNVVQTKNRHVTEVSFWNRTQGRSCRASDRFWELAYFG